MNNVNVKAWYNTGFNATNIPADTNGTWATECYSQTFPALQILQHVNLESIKIKASYPDVVDIDYIRLDPPYAQNERPSHGGSTVAFSYAYYFVMGAQMLNGDTCLLTLFPDYVNTAGGFANLKFLDGYTNRLTIKKSDDVFGAYTQEDPYLNADDPLELNYQTIDPSSGTDSEVTYVESTIDLGVMGETAYSLPYKSDGASEIVTVPKAYPNFHEPTKYGLANNPTTDTPIEGKGNRTVVVPMTNVTLPASTKDIIKNGIENCRAIGIESVVVQTAIIPTQYVVPFFTPETVKKNASGNDYVTVLDSQGVDVYAGDVGDPITEWGSTETERTWQICEQLVGVWNKVDTNVDPVYSNQYDNKRILYGEMNRMGIITNAGNRISVKPEEIYHSGSTIEIVYVGDPHLNGKPYFRFRYLNGDDGMTVSPAFFQNAVSGMQWKTVPIMYTEKSGNWLDEQEFYGNKVIKSFEDKIKQSALITKGYQLISDFRTKQNELMGAGIGGTLMGGVGGAMAGGPAGAMTGAIGAGISGASNFFSFSTDNMLERSTNEIVNQYKNNDMISKLEKEQELKKYLTSIETVAPDIAFPYNNDGYRDFFGDGFVFYYYRPTTKDLQKMDKILNMYGYVTHQPVTANLLNNRQKFVYIEANVSVGGNIPKWLSDGVSNQISNGVRLWKVKPDPSYYERGGNPDVV